jgi:hypothetical protein
MDKVIDKLILEWSWRCEKGYPDINNPADKKVLEKLLAEYGVSLDTFVREQEEREEQKKPTTTVEDLTNLLKSSEYDPKLLNRIQRMLQDAASVSTLKKELEQRNINKYTFDNRDLPDDIISILQRGDQSDVQLFIKNLENKPSLNLNGGGNIFSHYDTALIPKLKKLGYITGASKVVSMGKGEILFPLTYTNVEFLGTKAGDFKIDGKNVELKATGVGESDTDAQGARLGEGRTGAPYPPITFKVTDKDVSTPSTILKDYEKGKITQKQQDVITNVEEYLKKVYFKGKKAIKVTPKDLESITSVQNLLYKALIEGYATVKTIDNIILFNPVTGYYEVYTPDTLIQALQNGSVTTTNFTRSTATPQLLSFK